VQDRGPPIVRQLCGFAISASQLATQLIEHESEATHLLFPFSQDASNADLGAIGIIWLEELNPFRLLGGLYAVHS
jgi:hypothetical protein